MSSTILARPDGSGFQSINALSRAVVLVSSRWTFFGRVAYNTLRGDAAVSPVMVDRNQASLVGTLGYRF